MSSKRKFTEKLAQPNVKPSAKAMVKGNTDESKAVVSGGWNNPTRPKQDGAIETIDISSDSSAGEEEEEKDDDDEEVSAAGNDVAMDDVVEGQNGNEETTEPSFGDLVRANASEPIDVAGAFDDQAVVYPKGAQIQPPSGASLGTVLTQALKTNDVALLESCLHTTDIATIRATVQRLESPLAGSLLQKLADRLHRRPGRAGSLMVWIQWTLITHGGYLATQRDLIKKLAELNKVIDGRAKGLQPLLSLKGKLDMLEAQIELRRSMQDQRRLMDEDEDDEGVIYVEDQESEDDVAKLNGNLDISDAESEMSEDMPTTNGIIADSEDEEGESSDDDGGFLDDEAEETDADSGDEDEVDHNDQDSQGDDDESDEGAAPPAKMARTGSSSKRR